MFPMNKRSGFLISLLFFRQNDGRPPPDGSLTAVENVTQGEDVKLSTEIRIDPQG